jgi:hypothetical protein
VWEDLAVWNVDFVSIFKNLNIKDLGFLEKQLLKLLEYNVSVPSSLYAKYYFELRELAEKDAKSFPLTPLDKDRAEQLEVQHFPIPLSRRTLSRSSVAKTYGSLLCCVLDRNVRARSTRTGPRRKRG